MKVRVWFFGPKSYSKRPYPGGIEFEPYFERDVEMTPDEGNLNYPIIRLVIDGVDRTFYYRGKTTCLHDQEAEMIRVEPDTSHLRGKVEVKETFYRPVALGSELECVKHSRIFSPDHAWWDNVADPCKIFQLGLGQFDPFFHRTPLPLSQVQEALRVWQSIKKWRKSVPYGRIL